jgi:AbrB family looped-hinge helix DNA binding protein
MRTTNIRPVGPRNQVTIPPALLHKFNINPGDMVKFFSWKDGILIKPVTVVEKTQVFTRSEIKNINKLIKKQMKDGEYVEVSGQNAISYLKRKIKK